jgi:membrane protein YdbS with pleckstrin-like domain
MSFVNTQIDIGELPDFDAVDVIDIDPRFARKSAAIAAAIAGLVAVVLGTVAVQADDEPQFVLGLLVVAALVVGSLVSLYTYAFCRRIRYALRTHDIVVHKGVFFFAETIQPLTRVQHVELKRGPLDKRYGLASLKLFSAGLGKETFTLPGLRVEDAERVRAHVLGHREQQNG